MAEALQLKLQRDLLLQVEQLLVVVRSSQLPFKLQQRQETFALCWLTCWRIQAQRRARLHRQRRRRRDERA